MQRFSPCRHLTCSLTTPPFDARTLRFTRLTATALATVVPPPPVAGRRGRRSATATATATAGTADGAIVNARLTASPVPALSTARTATLCAPGARPANAFGLVHAANAPPSRLHSIRVTSPSGLENRALAVVPETSTPSIAARGAGSS